jgi:replication factor A1
MFSGSTMTVDPDIPQAHALRGWYDNQGTSTTFRAQTTIGAAAGAGGGFGTFNYSELKTIGVVQDTLHGLGDKPDYFSTRATVIHIKSDNMSYTSCPGLNCQKKVLEQDDGSWRCEKCAKSYDHCEYR